MRFVTPCFTAQIATLMEISALTEVANIVIGNFLTSFARPLQIDSLMHRAAHFSCEEFASFMEEVAPAISKSVKDGIVVEVAFHFQNIKIRGIAIFLFNEKTVLDLIRGQFLMTKDDQLAYFAEWNPNPIIELNMAGAVTYANLVARTNFPDLTAAGHAHPILKGLENVIAEFQHNQQSELTLYEREIDLSKKSYEQQLFGFPNGSIYIFMIDVSERKQLKAQAHFNDKLATIATLAAAVSHEISDPITWILGNINLLKNFTDTLKTTAAENKNPPELIAKIEETTSEILQGVEQIRDISSSLKNLAHVDKNEMVAVDVHKTLNMAVTIAALEFKNKASLVKNYSEDMPLILSNPGKLHQVFLNLLINAAQSFPRRDLQKNKIDVITFIEKNQLRIAISDNGSGIPPAVLPKIFDPFFTTKKSGLGSGLGLSICRDIINELKGTISVKSTVGKGTVFSICLPVSLAIAKKLEEPCNNVIANHKKHILLVDNEPMLLKLLRMVLEKQNQITAVVGGSRAKEIIAEQGNEFDLIITDLNMPEISGSDLYHFAAEKYPGLEKRFIFITGGVEMPWVKEFLKSTGNPVLEKPFLPKDLLELVNQIEY